MRASWRATNGAASSSRRKRRSRSPSIERPESQNPSPPRRWRTSMPEAREITYREAVREAMVEAMREDDSVFLMGEDVGVYGGAFGVRDRKSTRLNSSHANISYAVFCL